MKIVTDVEVKFFLNFLKTDSEELLLGLKIAPHVKAEISSVNLSSN